MQGCNIFQCLIHRDKSPNSVPEPYDLDFELEGKFFLSGISDHMPSRDQNNPTVIPERHGVDKPNADPVVWEVSPPSSVFITRQIFIRDRLTNKSRTTATRHPGHIAFPSTQPVSTSSSASPPSTSEKSTSPVWMPGTSPKATTNPTTPSPATPQ